MNLLQKNLPAYFTVIIAVLTLAFASQLSAQQTGGGDGDLGAIGGDDLANDIINMVNQGGGPGAANNDGAADSQIGDIAGDTGADGIGPQLDLSDIFDQQAEVAVDERQTAGFVGPSASAERGEDFQVQQFQFVGPRLGDSGAVTGQPGRTNAGGNRGGGNAGGATSGTSVQRTNAVRARLVPRFRAPRIAPTTVTSRVSRRLSTLPATRQFANSMNVSMQGRTAVISGTARNQEQVNRISRQLRLEPGVSRVVNRVSVAQ